MRKAILKKCRVLAATAIAALVMTPGTAAAQARGSTAQPGSSAGSVSAAGNAKIEQTVLAPIHQGNEFKVSRNGIHTATLAHSGSRQVIIYDGVEGLKFDRLVLTGNAVVGSGLDNLAFSPDGSRYAYCAQVGDHFVVMLDGKEVGQSSEANNPSGFDCQPFFSPNSKRFFYTSAVNKGDNRTGSAYTRFVMDGQTELKLVGLDRRSLVFSPDGDHFAAVVSADLFHSERTTLIVDGKPAGYAGGEPQWSADSKHLYTKLWVPAPRGQVQQLQLDGKPILRANSIQLMIPPVGDMAVTIVGVANNGGNTIGTWFLLVGGKRVPGSELLNAAGSALIETVVFSPDGKRYAAVYKTGAGREFVFADGKKGLEYQGVGGLHMSPNPFDYPETRAPTNEPVTFTADSSKVVYAGHNGNGTYLVIGDQESEAPNTMTDTLIAPVGSHVAAKGYTVTLDGVTVPMRARDASCTVIQELHFSRDGNRYAFGLPCGGAPTLYLDGVPQPAYSIAANEYPTFHFSPDSRHIAYFCRSTNPAVGNDQGLCVDGRYVRLGPPGYYVNLTFTSDSNHLLWLASESGQDFRVFVDGKPVFGPFYLMMQGHGPVGKEMWQTTADGALLLLGEINNAMERITITPSPNTSIATLFGGAPGLAAKQ